MAIESTGLGRVPGRLRAILLLVLLCSLGGFAGMARAGYAAIVVDGNTGQVLQQVNADQRDYPASLTKMMTLYLTFQGLKSGKLRLDQPMAVSAWAAGKSPTKLGLRAGQTVSVQDCVLGMITKSANDAATVMAEGIGGSESHFAEMMNAQAALLGMSNTHFANASGLPDPNNTSTAHDLVKLAMALYRDFPQYAHFFATQEFVFRGHIVRGHNHLMYRYAGMDGLKTGYTDASGFNLASTAVRGGHRLFAVVLGSRTAAVRDNLMARLLDDGFEGQQTPPILVAEAAGVRAGSRAARILEAISPIQTADADTVPASQRHPAARQSRHGRRAVVANRGCSTTRGTACRTSRTHRARHASPKLAAHHPRTRKPPVVVASRRDTDG
ncbi:D-alanyl-D-alanine carboxypeptidase family protein [Rhodanobacter geophilus]|uniref:D-alanyl-D-alanine carboxypeptidase family protein n=1 Tax=Rhodanobacter geophilus TaxID=3162488 RepID=A0ABV3QS50_9GAMM